MTRSRLGDVRWRGLPSGEQPGVKCKTSDVYFSISCEHRQFICRLLNLVLSTLVHSRLRGLRRRQPKFERSINRDAEEMLPLARYYARQSHKPSSCQMANPLATHLAFPAQRFRL